MSLFDIFGGSGDDYTPTSSDYTGSAAMSMADLFGEGGNIWGAGGPSGFDIFGGTGEDFVPTGSDYTGAAREAVSQRLGEMPDLIAYYQNTQGPEQGFLGSAVEQLDKVGAYLQTPGGKLLAGLGGAGLGALGAMKQRAAMKKLAALQDARRQEALKYSSPITPTFSRGRVDPTARQGASVWYSGNNVSLPKAASGGSTNPDAPSFIGFLRYVANGKRLPSEIAEAKRAEQQARQARAEQMLDGGIQRASIRDRADAIRAASGEQVEERARGGYLSGGSSGQSDQIPAMLSDGEYVMDADIVSALGDGNNAAGAAKLDQMRSNIRSHKRSASADKIPPRAKTPLAYMGRSK